MERQETCMLQRLAKYDQPLSTQNKSILAHSLTKINDSTIKPINHDLQYESTAPQTYQS